MSKRSPIWFYFSSITENSVKCNICKSVYSVKNGNTSNLKKHLRHKHPTVNLETDAETTSSIVVVQDRTPISTAVPSVASFLRPLTNPSGPSSVSIVTDLSGDITPDSEETGIAEDARPPKRQRSIQIQSSLRSYCNCPMDINRHKKIDNLVLEMIVGDLHTLSLVEEKGFKNLLEECVPTYKLPSRKRITDSLLTEKYHSVVEAVKAQLADIDSVTLTTAMWTSIGAEAFIALRAHFITKGWELKSVLLSCCRFEGTHTSEHIRSAVLGICKDWNIEKKVHALVTDNASNMKRAVQLLEFQHWPCLADSLNIIVQKAILESHNLRSKAKRLVKFFHRSTTAAGIFKNIQLGKPMSTAGSELSTDNFSNLDNESDDDDDDKDDLFEVEGSSTLASATGHEQQNRKVAYKLIRDVDTRWNSTLLMFERICLVQEPLAATIALLQNRRYNLPSFDSNDMKTMSELCKILKPFGDIITELSAEKNVSASKVLVLVQFLVENTKDLKNSTQSTVAKNVASALLKGLQERFSEIADNKLLCMASFLDPRFKRRGIESEAALQDCKDAVESHIRDMLVESVSVVEPNVLPENSNSIWGDFDTKNSSDIIRTTPSATASMELRKYWDEPAIMRLQNPLEWWRTHEACYPRIAKLARKHLSLVATSVPSERVFSKAGQLISERRSRLSDVNAEKILFLNGNKASGIY